MRIQSVISSFKKVNKVNCNQTQFESNAKNSTAHRGIHRYSGNWSADLAYASLVDDNIARDLASMNLIA